MVNVKLEGAISICVPRATAQPLQTWCTGQAYSESLAMSVSQTLRWANEKPEIRPGGAVGHDASIQTFQGVQHNVLNVTEHASLGVAVAKWQAMHLVKMQTAGCCRPVLITMIRYATQIHAIERGSTEGQIEGLAQDGMWPHSEDPEQCT